MDKLLIKILRLWNGKEPLSVAFWGLYLPIAIIYRVLEHFAKNNYSSTYVEYFGILIMALFIPMKILSLVALWRCAPNTKEIKSPFTWLARGLVLLNLAPLIIVALIPILVLFEPVIDLGNL